MWTARCLICLLLFSLKTVCLNENPSERNITWIYAIPCCLRSKPESPFSWWHIIVTFWTGQFALFRARWEMSAGCQNLNTNCNLGEWRLHSCTTLVAVVMSWRAPLSIASMRWHGSGLPWVHCIHPQWTRRWLYRPHHTRYSCLLGDLSPRSTRSRTPCPKIHVLFQTTAYDILDILLRRITFCCRPFTGDPQIGYYFG